MIKTPDEQRDCDAERKSLLDLLVKTMKIELKDDPAEEEEIILMDYNKGYDDDYIDFICTIVSFEDCFIEEYDNVVDIERYKNYKLYQSSWE